MSNNTLEDLASEWSLSDLKPIEQGADSDILSGLQGDRPIVLKCRRPDDLPKEARALNAFKSYGAVEVLAQQPGALLMERAEPGTSLKSYFPDQDEQSVKIACEVMEKLHQAPVPAKGAFPHIRDWLATLDKEWDMPVDSMKLARTWRDDLLATAGPDVLLHGDLHHENILKNGDNWVVIDPKGVIGERAYEVCAFIRNPIPELLAQEDARFIIQHRIQAFSKMLNIDEKRICQWCFVQAVLCWVWSLEDGLDPGYFKSFISHLM